MKILYIYRNPLMGFSIEKVFKPIEEWMKTRMEVDSIYLPAFNYSPIGLWKNIRMTLQTVRQKKYDIIHITGGDNYLLPFLRNKIVLVTVHDLGFYTNHKKTMRAKWSYLTRVLPLKMATKATFISTKSLCEAKELINLREDQYVIIPNTVNLNFAYKEKKINIDNPVILHIGTGPNKNLLRTIDALKNIQCHLRIVGRLEEKEYIKLSSSNISYSNVYNLTDEEMLEEYVKCDIVNFPSYYEGFGMPIIEGQKIGRVVVTSNIPPMNEVAGDGAVLVDPFDVKSIHNGYMKAMESPELYIRKGIKNVERFDIDYIANKYLALYQDVNQ